MSHELRTPLHGMLALSELLAENSDKNLTSQQIDDSESVNNETICLTARGSTFTLHISSDLKK